MTCSCEHGIAEIDYMAFIATKSLHTSQYQKSWIAHIWFQHTANQWYAFKKWSHEKSHTNQTFLITPTIWLLFGNPPHCANDNLAWIRNNCELPAVKTYLDSATEINPCVHYSLFGFVLCIFRCLIIRSWHQLSRRLRATILSIPRLVCFSSLWNMPEPPATKPQSE